jgi:hypothetical protein
MFSFVVQVVKKKNAIKAFSSFEGVKVALWQILYLVRLRYSVGIVVLNSNSIIRRLIIASREKPSFKYKLEINSL